MKRIGNIFHRGKNQVRRLCVGKHLIWVRSIFTEHCEIAKKYNGHISAYTPSTHLIFGTVKDTDNIYYSTKNQVRGLYVGGDMAILFFGDFTKIISKTVTNIWKHTVYNNNNVLWFCHQCHCRTLEISWNRWNEEWNISRKRWIWLFSCYYLLFLLLDVH